MSHDHTKRTTLSKAGNKKPKSHLTLDNLLQIASRGGASDVIIKVDQIPMFRLNGDLYPLKDGKRVTRELLDQILLTCLSADQVLSLDNMEDVDLSYNNPSVGRVRMNIFRQRGDLGIVMRLISRDIPTIDALGMSPILKSIASTRRGLVLVTGATGSGKSTTLAAMINHINTTRTSHIITIEDPIEFEHQDNMSLINQRELGLDTTSFASALRSALRQDPDVILVGELRDRTTIEVALSAAETGHLVMSTMHTNDASDAIVRILSSVEDSRKEVVRTQVGENLRAVVSQRLVKRRDGRGRIAAQEIMVNTGTIRERIVQGESPKIVRDYISQGGNSGMQTFDQHLYELYRKGVVTYEEAYKNATQPENFKLLASGVV